MYKNNCWFKPSYETMTLYEFKIFSFEDKYKAVIDQGVFLDKSLKINTNAGVKTKDLEFTFKLF